jgi:hypothetical protein
LLAATNSTFFFDFSQATTPTGLEFLLLSFVVGFLVGVIVKHAIKLGIAVLILTVIAIFIGGVTTSSLTGMFGTIWGMVQGLLPFIRDQFTREGFASVIVATVGFLISYFGISLSRD